MQLLYKNVTAFQDECINAALMQIVTAPLTTFYSIQKIGIELKERLTIHFIGMVSLKCIAYYNNVPMDFFSRRRIEF